MTPVKRKFTGKQIFLLTSLMSCVTNNAVMTPPPSSEPDSELTNFKQTVRDWLSEHNFTQKELGLRLGVTYGTVRNWLSSDSNISETNRNRILAFMDNPAAFKKNQAETSALATLNITPLSANMPMWRSAAQVKNVSFRRGTKLGVEALEFAKWSTPLISSAVREELKKHTPEKLKEQAKLVHIGNDPLTNLEEDSEYSEHTPSDDELERMNNGISIQLPVLANRINILYLAIAARCAGKEKDDFIADVLNAAADADFGTALIEFLNQEEEGAGEAAAPKRQDDDDIPF